MKKKLFSLLFAIAASIGTMFADRTKIGDLYYNLNATDQTAEVTYKSRGNYSYNEGWNITTANIPASVAYNGTTYSVTSIGDYAFSGCSSLTFVAIPNSVASIGQSAFYNCSGLTSVTIGNSVTSIGNYAFRDCSGLTSVMIPNSVTSIGNSAFINCSSLTSVTIGNSVTSIGSNAFQNCSGLTSVTIGNSVTSIGKSAFYGCSSLTSVTIPNSVTSIGNNAFYSVNNIIYSGEATGSPWGAKSVNGYMDGYLVYSDATKTTLLGCSAAATGEIVIPSSVTSIGYGAFRGCSSLTSVTCEATAPPTLGGSSVFSGVDKSIPVYVPGESVDLYKAADRWKEFTNILPIEETPAPCILASGTCGAQGNNLIWKLSCDNLLTISGSGAMADYSSGSAPWYTNRTSITSIIINNSVTSIGNYAFQNCSGLTSVTIPNSVTSIGTYAFQNCSSLTSVTIGNSVTSIGTYAFSHCSSLTSVTIPNSVTSIGSYAFGGCTGLTKVNITDIAAWCNIAFGNETSNPLYNAKHLFVNDVEVTDLVIPNSVASIGKYAFYNCSSLSSVTIPSDVSKIGANAFYRVNSIIYSGTATGSPWGAKSVNGYVDGYLVYSDDTKTNLIGCSSAATGEIVIPSSVTSIGKYAFYNCSGLTSVTIPNSVTSIGSSAFSGCTGLTKVNITDIAAWCNIAFDGNSSNPLHYAKHLFVNDVEAADLIIPNGATSIGQFAFYFYPSLSSVTIPNSVTSIGEFAFCGCNGLTSVTIPNSVTNIGNSAFNNCSSLISVTIPNSVTSIGNNAFGGVDNIVYFGTATGSPWGAKSVNGYVDGYLVYSDDTKTTLLSCSAAATGEIIIPNSVTSIGERAFDGCSGLTSVTIPNSVTSIGSRAFNNCSSLISVTIPNSVTSIGDWAFGGCSSLTSVTIPNSVTSIGQYAFYNCSGLTSVTIPNSVTSIGNNAFSGCSGLTKVNITDIAAWCNIAFGNSASNPLNNAKHLFVNDIEVTELTIPNGVTSIGQYAFYNCSSLTSVTIPNSVISIGQYAFDNCSSLTSVTIPNSVTSIGSSAFYNCSGLTSVTIPNSVTSIGNYAFSGCSSLTSVTIPNSVTSIGGSAFYRVNNIIYSGEATGSPWGAKSVNGYVDGYFVYSDETKTNLLGCSAAATGEIVIPNSVTSIGQYAFYNCSGLTSVTIPNSVTSIGSNAFQNCSGLTDIYVCGDLERFQQLLNNDDRIKVGMPYTITINAEYGNVTYPQTMCEDMSLTATPEYGYHFVKWSDGNTANPRTIELTRDTTFTAQFAPNQYTLSLQCDDNQGSVEGAGVFDYLAQVQISATPNYGYHFVKWSDGNTDNPRTIVLTQDTTFTAEFAKNTYTISTTSANPEWGTTAGGKSALYLDEVEISATPNYGYHFVKWSDGNTDNPRTIVLTQDTTFTAEFAKNTYTISTTSANPEWGTTAGGKSALYLDEVEISATPNYGYHFVKWSDGNTDNPRTIVLTQDTTFIAEFAKNTYTISTESANPEWGTTAGGTALYLDNLEISATPNYGYHFVQWNDGNTTNPRTVSVTEDKSYTATFAKNTYSITKIANNEQGSVSGPVQGEYLDNITLTVTPEYGYHFAQWNDGNTDNPRTFVLTKDTTFTAQFAPNQYTLSLQCDDNQGTVEGAGLFDYLAQVQISATPAYGYHFSSWSDGNTDNPRTYTVTKDVTITANFAPNTYTLNVSCNAEQGSVTGSGSYNYLSNRAIEAIPSYGYHFAQWNDGNTDNPRTIELRQDTTLEAIFAVDKYGTCGDNLQLTWRYDTGSQTLTISGEGDLTTNMRYGVEAVKEMKELIIEDGVGVIGNEAFANIKTLNTITLGKDVRKLQERVFYNCYNLTAIYNYRKTPASATSNTFEEVDKYACTIYVLAGSEEMFRNATGWKDFYSILTIGASETTVTDNNATVVPSANSATVTWPVSNEAASYTIEITKDGVVFCRLTFNANGQLTGIAFAPGRDGQSMAPAAVMTASGLQFTVTGLDSNTQYGYNVTANDANEQPIATYSGSFTTTSEGVPTGIDNTAVEQKITKILRNGEVLILRDGKTYTVQGQEVR